MGTESASSRLLCSSIEVGDFVGRKANRALDKHLKAGPMTHFIFVLLWLIRLLDDRRSFPSSGEARESEAQNLRYVIGIESTHSVGPTVDA